MIIHDILFDRRTLQIGSTGENVRTLQQALDAIGYLIKVTGIYNKNTEASIMDYQKSHNLKVDGVVGIYTIMSLLRIPSAKKVLLFVPHKTVSNVDLPHITVTYNKRIMAKLKSLPSWVWYAIIGFGVVTISSGDNK